MDCLGRPGQPARTSSGRRGRREEIARDEPRLEVDVPEFEHPVGPVSLHVGAADQPAVDQDRQSVVAVRALRPGTYTSIR